MRPEEIKKAVFQKIDENRDTITGWANDLLRMPELGFREVKTAGYMKRQFAALGLSDIREGLVLTGVSGRYAGAEHAGTVGVMGELDALVCEGHPYADPSTNAAHACGHYVQLTSVLGCALALRDYMQYLGGDVEFIAVPCEEGVSLDYRDYLEKERGLRLFGGKQEFIRRGYVNDLDAVVMMHTAPVPETVIDLPTGGRTFGGKKITIEGKAAHSGGESHLGVNALQCANLIISGINAIRETFRTEDLLNVNVILTEGGTSAGTVPGRAVLEVNIRAGSTDAVERAGSRIDRIAEGCAYALGADVKIRDYPGYLPLHDAGYLVDVMRENAEALIGKEHVSVTGGTPAIMTDTGDLSHCLPAVQASIGGGFIGMHHRRDFVVKDEESAYILPVKLLAGAVVDLLADWAKKLKRVKESFDYPFGQEPAEEYAKRYGVSVPAGNRGSQKLPDRSCGSQAPDRRCSAGTAEESCGTDGSDRGGGR